MKLDMSGYKRLQERATHFFLYFFYFTPNFGVKLYLCG